MQIFTNKKVFFFFFLEKKTTRTCCSMVNLNIKSSYEHRLIININKCDLTLKLTVLCKWGIVKVEWTAKRRRVRNFAYQSRKKEKRLNVFACSA